MGRVNANLSVPYRSLPYVTPRECFATIRTCCLHTWSNAPIGSDGKTLEGSSSSSWAFVRGLRDIKSSPDLRRSDLGGASRSGASRSWCEMGMRHAVITYKALASGRDKSDISPPATSTPLAAPGDSLYSILPGVCTADRCMWAVRERVCCGDVTGGVWVRSVSCTCCFRRRSRLLRSVLDVPFYLGYLREAISSSCHAFC